MTQTDFILAIFLYLKLMGEWRQMKKKEKGEGNELTQIKEYKLSYQNDI